jgi:PAS domain S-box-containing protein
MTLFQPDALVLASILQIATDAVICVNDEHRIVYFNDGAAQMFGYPADEMIGAPLRNLMPAKFGDAHAGHVKRFGSGTSTSRRMAERSTIYGLRSNGEEFVAQAGISRVQTDNGPLFAVVMRDMSEQRRTEVLLEDALARAEDAIRDRDDMLSLVNHDLRNPVNAVKMLASALLRLPTSAEAADLPVVAREHANVMLQSATQMDALIQDLLDVARLERGTLRLACQTAAISPILTLAADILAPMAAEKHITLETEIEAGLPPVSVDPDRVGQVLSNLLGNALKFTPEGGSVRLRAIRTVDAVEVRVQDSGIRIKSDDLPFIFDRFWQAKRTDRSGAGLGLAIAKGIVQAHGGTIVIESVLGQGTIVRFTLPAALAN